MNKEKFILKVLGFEVDSATQVEETMKEVKVEEVNEQGENADAETPNKEIEKIIRDIERYTKFMNDGIKNNTLCGHSINGGRKRRKRRKSIKRRKKKRTQKK